jgi:AcrR family transcriptional regulator
MPNGEKTTHRQRQKENTRVLILNTAYKLFAEEGYANTTMRLLAKKAGVGLGTICKHFPDKPSLLVDAYQDDLGGIIIEAFRTIPKTGVRNQLSHITKYIYTFYAADPEFSKNLIKESLFLGGKYGRILDSQLQTFLEKISELILLAVDRCELAPETDVFDLTQTYGAFYFSVLIMALKKADFDAEEEAERVCRMLEKNLQYGDGIK